MQLGSAWSALCATACWVLAAILLQRRGPDCLTVEVPLSHSIAVVLPSPSRCLAVSWGWLSSPCCFRREGQFLRDCVHQPPADLAALPCGAVVYGFTYQWKITEEAVLGRGGPWTAAVALISPISFLSSHFSVPCYLSLAPMSPKANRGSIR